MGLFNAISNWSNGRYEKRVSKMQEQGHCPDCGGRGVQILPYEHYYNSAYHCPGCNGSGQFEDWMR
ncbi:methionine aminopeptidase [Aquibacillus rhizosphaerae]|uniref:Methionine aminopeptidase n=1 Tax=Aquibacillus rhizosphaerae TaxID=3051431 RepID=A0ABT7L501_9BACI|nr:methionine aminopeptidase [Aquibacillus sp. LR5S19]MDL4840262.1 methionine aminopeptidase [Aquibacillus sp. LR5S19]